MTSLIHQVKENWLIIAGLVSAVFYLHKLRLEETLRTKLKLIYECYGHFAEINDDIQFWSNPAGRESPEKRDDRLIQSLRVRSPKANASFHQASILIHPLTVKEMNRIFDQINLIFVEYDNWKMFREANGANAGDYTKELKVAFDNARKELPRAINETVNLILGDFQLLAHGPVKVLFWKIAANWWMPFLRKYVSFDNQGRWTKQDRDALLKSLNTKEAKC